jgi:hypothetical protein
MAYVNLQQRHDGGIHFLQAWWPASTSTTGDSGEPRMDESVGYMWHGPTYRMLGLVEVLTGRRLSLLLVSIWHLALHSFFM